MLTEMGSMVKKENIKKRNKMQILRGDSQPDL